MKRLILLVVWLLLISADVYPQPGRCSGYLMIATQRQLDAFSCTSFTGTLIVAGERITDLSPLASLEQVNGNLMIVRTGFTSLAGLEGLTGVNKLTISGNSQLTDISAISGLTSVEEVELINNSLLEVCNPLQPIIPMLKNLFIWGNAPSCLITATQCLPPEPEVKICTGDIIIDSQAKADTFSCEIVTGNLKIFNYGASLNISHFTFLKEVWKNLTLGAIEFKQFTDGLQGLDSIGGYLIYGPTDGIIYGNDLSKFESLKHVKGIRANNSFFTGAMPELIYPMTILQASVLYGVTSDIPWLTQIPSIDSLYINGLSDNTVLNGKISENGVFRSTWGNHPDLSFLSTNTALNELTVYANSTITTLSGAEGLTTINGNLTLEDNPSLTDCCPIYDLLNSGTVSGSITIAGNGAGCTLMEILASCAPEGESEELVVYPNPGTDGNVNIQLNTPVSGQGALYLLNDFGEVERELDISLEPGQNAFDLDVSGLKKGAHIIRIVAEGKVYWTRLLK